MTTHAVARRTEDELDFTLIHPYARWPRGLTSHRHATYALVRIMTNSLATNKG